MPREAIFEKEVFKWKDAFATFGEFSFYRQKKVVDYEYHSFFAKQINFNSEFFIFSMYLILGLLKGFATFFIFTWKFPKSGKSLLMQTHIVHINKYIFFFSKNSRLFKK